MKPLDIIRMCIRNLTKRKMRTFLTVLGVIIGTCAIIVMVSLGVGMDAAQKNMISEWADLTLINVYNYGGRTETGDEVAAITDDVIDEIEKIEHVQAVTPICSSFNLGYDFVLYSGDYSFEANLIGVYMDQLDNFGYTLSEGRFKEAGDGKYSVIIGEQVGAWVYNFANEEYENCDYDEEGNASNFPADPMHMEDSLKIIPMAVDPEKWTGEVDYSVIGSPTAVNNLYEIELNPIGKLKGSWNDYYTMQGILIDVSTMNDFIEAYNELNPDNERAKFEGKYDNIRIRVDDMDKVGEVEEAVKAMGYETYSDNQLRDNMKQQTQMIQMMLGALAAVSLFVAALNIANTMVMSIYERTKEIGIMKVLGCDVSKIRAIFLAEAASIGFIGGIFGTVLSYLISFLLNTFFSSQIIQMMSGDSYGLSIPEGTDISAIPLWLVGASMIFATVVGLVSGFFPANRSAKISALSAITHE